MAAAHQLPSALRAVTFETLIGLLAVTGIRIGEALPCASTVTMATAPLAYSWCGAPNWTRNDSGYQEQS
jgi:hypothetical protein